MSTAHALAIGIFVSVMTSCSPTAGRSPAASSGSAPTCAAGAPRYASAVLPVVQRYCVSCHSPDGDAGDEHDFTLPERLHADRRLISARLRAHSMPPATSPQPSALERALVADWADCGAKLD